MSERPYAVILDALRHSSIADEVRFSVSRQNLQIDLFTNDYRAMWAAQGEADVRTVVDPACIQPCAANAFDGILRLVTA